METVGRGVRHIELGVALALALLVMDSRVSAHDAALDVSQQTRVGAQASDRNGKVPPGSYQLTCVVLDAPGNDLKAICQKVDGDWLTTELHNTDRCPADVSNENGKLTCNRKQAGPPEALLAAFGEGVPGLAQRVSPWTPLQMANWQLRHDTWTFKDGAPEGVRALAQTNDGLLWLGGSTGLYRFDGRQFELFHSSFGEELLSTNISSLYTPPSGGLWIGYVFGGASFVDKGRVENYGGEFATNSGSIRDIVQDKDGTVWAAGPSSGLWRLEHSEWERIGAEWNAPIKSASEAALDRNGDLWVTGDRKLLRLRRGSRRFELVQDNLPLDTQHMNYAGRLVDEEGNIWFSGQRGLDRFFYSSMVEMNLPREAYGFALVADDAGKVLAGGPDSTLYRVDAGKIETLRAPNDWGINFIYRAADNTLWLGATTSLWHETVSHQRPLRNPEENKEENKGEGKASFDMREALWRFTGRDWNKVELPREVAGQEEYLQAIAEDRAGGMWVSLGRHGLYRLAGGVWTSYGGRKDLPAWGVICEFRDRLGRLWLGSPKSQLALLDGERLQVFGPNDGVQIGNITAIYGRGSRIWIGGEFGIQQFDAGQFKLVNAGNNEWLRGISGIVETANGDLWLNGLSGIFHIRQSELAEALKDPSYKVKGEHFARRDGLPGFATQLRPLPSAVEASDGRIWFALTNDVVWVDPALSEHHATAPPVTVQSVSAGGRTYDLMQPLKFPARTSSVQISYNAVSLSNPEAIRFRYKLQETDSDWHEVATASPVTYRNLPPGSYHFSLTASDTNGNWPDKAAGIEFSIQPAFYQTMWFRLLCAACFVALLFGAYRLRLHEVEQQFNARVEGRVAERTRIARDLHDTMLQSFQGALLKFHVIKYIMRDRPAEAEKILESVIVQAQNAVTEGRDAVEGLRSSTIITNDLALALTTFGEQMVAEQPAESRPALRVEVKGTSRNLPPILRDDVYRIGAEALRNAFKHAQARRIKIEICYEARHLRLRVWDDGKGIDSKVLESGAREGHFGLPGMQERAKLAGGALAIRSEPGSGTETELTIPASIAYAKADDSSSSAFWRRRA